LAGRLHRVHLSPASKPTLCFRLNRDFGSVAAGVPRPVLVPRWNAFIAKLDQPPADNRRLQQRLTRTPVRGTFAIAARILDTHRAQIGAENCGRARRPGPPSEQAELKIGSTILNWRTNGGMTISIKIKRLSSTLRWVSKS
jgi:hypothetical protein